TIRPGQEIHLSEPDGKGGSARWHVVRRGESLWRIARRYGVRVADIIDWNRLARMTIHPGQSLRVY
ncbi:MAG: LysM peptidoglycan-binding domain-containing protein, partial [Candidatus Eisenbacteria bacterium]|nr:LysM peptidoglycan-binding domain-containing protein [Candidatus Eisenbacteria bacterium]